jgi:hypothetical protein
MTDHPILLMTEAHRPNVTPPPNERRRVLAWHLFVSSPDPTVEWGDDMHAEGLDTFEAWAEMPRRIDRLPVADLLAALGLTEDDWQAIADLTEAEADSSRWVEGGIDEWAEGLDRRVRAVLARLEGEVAHSSG